MLQETYVFETTCTNGLRDIPYGADRLVNHKAVLHCKLTDCHEKLLFFLETPNFNQTKSKLGLDLWSNLKTFWSPWQVCHNALPCLCDQLLAFPILFGEHNLSAETTLLTPQLCSHCELSDIYLTYTTFRELTIHRISIY
jgi:hypothetical protein